MTAAQELADLRAALAEYVAELRALAKNWEGSEWWTAHREIATEIEARFLGPSRVPETGQRSVAAEAGAWEKMLRSHAPVAEPVAAFGEREQE